VFGFGEGDLGPGGVRSRTGSRMELFAASTSKPAPSACGQIHGQYAEDSATLIR
jgi:hypothetical protein